jgi:hypothetical protein
LLGGRKMQAIDSQVVDEVRIVDGQVGLQIERDGTA